MTPFLKIILTFMICPGVPFLLVYLLTRIDMGDGTHGDPL